MNLYYVYSMFILSLYYELILCLYYVYIMFILSLYYELIL